MKFGLCRMILCVILCLGISFAQDNILQSYTLAIESLNEAVSAFESDEALSLEALDRAAQTLRPLSRDTTSTGLVTALESTFARTKTAIENKSTTDLTVQVAVLKGGFQRLVYESSIQLANEGNFELTRSRLTKLASDINAPEETLNAISSSTNFSGLLTGFDQGIAKSVQQNISSASEQRETDKDAAYINLATAYGAFLTVQDSPRIPTGLNETFIQAFNALVNEEATVLTESLGNLSTEFFQFEQNAQTGQIDSSANPDIEPIAEPAALAEPTVADLPSVEATEPVAATPDAPAPVTEENVSSEVETPTVDLSSLDALALRETFLNEQREEKLEAIRQEIGGYGISGSQAERLAQRYIDADKVTVDDAVNDLYALSAQIVVAVEVGNQNRVAELTREFKDNYQAFLEPLVAARDEAFNSKTLQFLRQIEMTPTPRLQDVVILSGHVTATTMVLGGGSSPGFHERIVSTAMVWIGYVRVILMVLLALSAFIPLYFLNLAFGGGNRSWRLIGFGLFCLLLPIIYEGLGFLFNILGGVTGIDAFNVLWVYAIFQNTLSQIAWVVVVALGILFTSLGLYGICVQFGLFDKQSAAVNNTTVRDPTTVDVNVDPATSDVDWDEEF